MSKNSYKIKNKKTGFEFLLPKEECDRLVMDEPHNFVVIDADYVSPLAAKEEKTSTYNKVVDNGNQDGEEEKEPKTLEDLTVAELKKILEEREIVYAKSAKKAELIELIQADDKKKEEDAADNQDGEEEKEEE